MKKLINTILIASLLAVALTTVGCGGNKDTSITETTPSETSMETVESSDIEGNENVPSQTDTNGNIVPATSGTEETVPNGNGTSTSGNTGYETDADRGETSNGNSGNSGSNGGNSGGNSGNNSTPTATPKPTQVAPVQTDPNETTEAHQHKWTAVKGTVTLTETVQQYAKDGTTNDYDKPIYETRTRTVQKTKEVPVYENHQFDINGRDATKAWENGGREEWKNSGNWNDNNSDKQNMRDWLKATVGSGSTYTDKVQVGTKTETYDTTEEYQEVVGYQQLGTTTKKTTVEAITGFTCSCGATMSVQAYMKQYGEPNGYYYDDSHPDVFIKS